ncbi:ABC transporter substrate-binding protein [Cohnella terricola]|uniref:Sugar ABC transporter substrate-binding protein n=1 Tax=Cohnella terricola TaxID=1289167 RepID=A0A559JT47_9BACL|nr:sugar ABC transporter substrate-binding protein [Cohnella terricola]TVY03045.1 sugar ABC transporter substrate-binding protein [Cohnella terricola]
MQTKKWIHTTLVLSLSSTLALTACSSSNNGPSSSPGSESTGKEGSPGKTNEKITFYAQYHPAIDALKPLIPDFEKETGIKVELNVLPYPQILDKQQVALTSGSESIDVGMADPMYLSQWNNGGMLTDLSALIADKNATNDERLALDDFMPQALKQMSKDNVQYALPLYAETTELFYNKKMLEDANVPVPTTLDELMEAAKKLHDPKKGQFGIVLRGQRGNGLNIFIWTGIYRSFGGEFLKDGANDFDSQAGVAATKWYGDILTNYGPPGASSIGWQEALDTFSQGKAAFMIDASTFAGSLEDSKKSAVAGNVGYATLPKGPNGSFPALAAWGMYIPKNSAKKEAAWKFIQWALSPEVQLKSAVEHSRSDVARQSVWQDESYRSLFGSWGNWADVTFDNINIASPDYRPMIKNWTQVGDDLGALVSAVTAKTLTADAAMKKAQEEIKITP